MDRRTLLGTGLALGAASFAGVRLTASAAPTDKRFLMVILRGAADGLSIAAPVADPGFDRLRAAWRDQYASATKLDGTFRLHPSLANVGKLYGQGDALVGHALATSYRDRSHFDAQNLLETGGTRAFELRDGFLNRFLGLMPQKDFPALALAPAIPVALRGSHQVSSYAPSKMPDASADLLNRVEGLYQPDPALAKIWQSAMTTHSAAAGSETGTAAQLGALAAKMMVGEQKARLVMIDLPGWDTHSGQLKRLSQSLKGLDAMLGAFHEGLGDIWGETLVAVVTEFGRTAAINGTGGTDHGTAGASLLLGGNVKGGRVVSDWPGLAQGQLLEGRDLRPTNATEAFLTGAMADHFDLDPARTFETLFPGRKEKAMSGLIA